MKPEKIQSIGVKEPVRNSSCETLYRVTIRNQLRSIGIADQKANIIIGINTILISIFIAVIGLVSNMTQLHFISNLNLSLPFTVMILSSFTFGALAIFAVRPAASLWYKHTPSNLSFRDFQHCNLNDFQIEMNAIISSKKSIYESLNIDMYLYGKCVQRKYRLLRHAYTVFLIGLTLAVISFCVLQIVGPDSL